MKYDDMILAVGGFGRFQKFFYFLTFMTSVPNGLITLMFVFIHYLPDYRCKIPLLENATGPEYDRLMNLTIPKELNEKQELVWSSCKRYNVSEDELMTMMNENQTSHSYGQIECDQGWTYDLQVGFVSATTEFNLVCGDSWKPHFAVSIYMLGMGTGAFSGFLADRFGRRTVFLWATFLGFAFNGMTGFAWNYPIYVICMFFTGLMGLVNFLVAFIMATEIMDVKHRNSMAIGPFVAFSVGYLFSPLVGFLLQNWRWYMWANSLLGVFYLPYFWVMPESPRWLITRGRINDAKTMLQKIAKMNRVEVNIDNMFQESVQLEEKRADKDTKATESSFIKVFFNRTLLPRVLAVFFAWFVTSMVYYALSLNTSNLGGNRFVNCVLSALAELPGYLLSWHMIKRIGRPRTLFLLMGVAGVCCFVVPLLQYSDINSVAIAVAMLGKGSISTVFYCAYVCSAEIAPTLVRNLTSGLASTCARIGGFTAPYLLYAGESIHSSIPYLVMGSLGILSAFLSIIFVPETRSVVLPDSKKEAMRNQRFYSYKLWKVPPNLTQSEEMEKMCEMDEKRI